MANKFGSPKMAAVERFSAQFLVIQTSKGIGRYGQQSVDHVSSVILLCVRISHSLLSSRQDKNQTDNSHLVSLSI
jgi:hypothetical protein